MEKPESGSLSAAKFSLVVRRQSPPPVSLSSSKKCAPTTKSTRSFATAVNSTSKFWVVRIVPRPGNGGVPMESTPITE